MKRVLMLASALLATAAAQAGDKAVLSAKDVSDGLVASAVAFCRQAEKAGEVDFLTCFKDGTDMAIEKLSRATFLGDGTVAFVYAKSGALTSYLKSAGAGSDGKAALVSGEVFDGTRLAKTPDGHCVKLVDRLIRMDDVVVGSVKIQRPVIQHTEESVPCSL